MAKIKRKILKKIIKNKLWIRVFFIAGCILVAAIFLYMLWQISLSQKQNKKLENKYLNLTEEKIRLKKELDLKVEEYLKKEQEYINKEQKIKVLETELSGLQNIKQIKEISAQNQQQLQQINEEFNKTKTKNASLTQENLTLSSRLKSITNEFSKTLETLKIVKKEFDKAKSDKTIQAYIRKIEQTEVTLKEKENKITELTQKIKEADQNSSNFPKERKKFERKISDLERDNQRLREQIEKTKNDYNNSSRLNNKVRELREMIKDKDREKQGLAQELGRLRKSKVHLEHKLESSESKLVKLEDELFSIRDKSRNIERMENEKQKLKEELFTAEQKLKEQEKTIANLESTRGILSDNEIKLSSISPDADHGNLGKAYALYDTAKAQVVKFSELLMAKELELENAKQKIKELENELSVLKTNAGITASGDLNRDSLLNDRVKILNEALIEKDNKMKQKDAELSALNMAKETLEEKIAYQEKEFSSASTMYSNLKSQMLQTTELLARRESALIEKNREVLGLKSELAIIQAEYKAKEQEVKDMQRQQRKFMDDLNRSTKLNLNLQEKLSGQYNNDPSDSEAKRKADELKREVERFLGK